MNSTSQRHPGSETSTITESGLVSERIADVSSVQPVQEIEKPPEDLNPGVSVAVTHEPILAYFIGILFCREVS